MTNALVFQFTEIPSVLYVDIDIAVFYVRCPRSGMCWGPYDARTGHSLLIGDYCNNDTHMQSQGDAAQQC